MILSEKLHSNAERVSGIFVFSKFSTMKIY